MGMDSGIHYVPYDSLMSDTIEELGRDWQFLRLLRYLAKDSNSGVIKVSPNNDSEFILTAEGIEVIKKNIVNGEISRITKEGIDKYNLSNRYVDSKYIGEVIHILDMAKEYTLGDYVVFYAVY